MIPARVTDPRARRALSVLLAGLLGFLASFALPAQADETTEPVQLTITSITPASTTGTGTVVIRGTARNTGTEALSGVQVYLWRSTDPIRDAPSLAAALDSAAFNPVGARLYEDRKNYFNITTTSAEGSQVSAGKTSLDAGESVDFTVAGDLAGAKGFGFTTTPAAYLVGLQVKAAGRAGVLGRARALLPVAAVNSVTSTVVVRIGSRPGLLQGSMFADDHLATELDGRLRTLMDLALTSGATALIDPALYDDVAVMAQGYTVQGSTASTAAGQAAAKSFLADLGTLIERGDAYRTPYGDPDIALLEAAGRHDVLDQATAAVPTTHAMAKLPLAIAPRDGAADADLIAFVADLDPALVLVAGKLGSAPVVTVDGTTIVRYAADAYDGGPGPDPTTTAPQKVGRLQATELVTPTVTIVTTAEQAALSTATAPWRSWQPLDERVAAITNPPTAELAKIDPVEVGNWLEQVDRAGGDVTVWGELTNQPEAAATALGKMLPRATSQAWGGRRPAAARWAKAVGSAYGNAATGQGVSLSVTPDIVTSAAEQEVPVTVTNHLDRAVSVKATFTSENPQRLVVADSELESIPAGGTETIRVTIQAKANGKVGVTGQLVTESGRPIGEAQSMTITATSMGRIGWIIIVGSGVVLLGATAMRIRQVQRERRAEQAVADLGQPRR